MATTTERKLHHHERVRLTVLALPTLALAFAITTVSAYLGKVTRSYTQNTIIIGIIIGGEGVMALWVPLIAGPWSDRLRSPIGGRLPFLIAGVVPAAVGLLLVGLLHSLLAVALAAGLFFAFYFVAYEPYRAMYPDLVESTDVAGRAQSAQAVARGLGTGLALVGSGLLLSVGRAAPFAFAAAVLLAATGMFVYLVLKQGLNEEQDDDATPAGPSEVARQLVGWLTNHPALRSYFIANALWEMALAALKSFIVLYLVLGLGYKLQTASLIIGGVAVVILIGAGAAGKVGDRCGRLRVVMFAAAVYGLGFIVPMATTNRAALGASVVPIALGGGTLMTLAYAILMPLMPENEHGALTGFYSLSRGIGLTTGPLLAGVLIYLTRHGPFTSTQGYQAMWIVCGAAALASVVFVRAMRRADRDRAELRRL